MNILLAQIISIIARILEFTVLADIILSYFMSPYQPIRQVLDRIVNPLLAPIRRLLPTAGGIDFSPLVLLILIQVLDYILTSLLLSIK